jgi:foldase protein PrsA
MTRRFSLVLVSLAMLAIVGAGCGGGGDKKTAAPSGAPPRSCSAKLGAGVVAAVCNATITRRQFDQVLQQAKRQFTLQKRTFPAAGSPDYQTLVGQVMEFLVQRSELAQKAEQLGVEVTDKQVADRLASVKKQCCGGSQKRYESQLKQQGLTDADVRADVRTQLVSEGVYDKVTARTTVTDKAVRDYYDAHLVDQYTQPARTDPASREVRHILVKSKKKADELRRTVTSANFAALARQNSLDTASKSTGGKLTISKGQTVAPFDKVAFALKKDEISQPVHTRFGWHIIQALSNVTPPKKIAKKVTPFSQVKSAIRAQLLSEKKSQTMQKWLADTKSEFAPRIRYAAGFAPPSTSATTTSAAPTTTG